MARPETQSREALVEALEGVFLRDGYEGASLARLAGAAGLAKAALYHRFPEGKEAMAQAVLEKGRAHLIEAMIEPLRTPGDPRQRLDTMMAALDVHYQGGAKSCVADIFSILGTPQALRGGLKIGMRAWIDGIKTALLDAGIEPAIAARRAQDAVIRIEGALVVSRALQDTAPFAALMARLTDELLAGH